jgi:hypothetical protein
MCRVKRTYENFNWKLFVGSGVKWEKPTQGRKIKRFFLSNNEEWPMGESSSAEALRASIFYQI